MDKTLYNLLKNELHLTLNPTDQLTGTHFGKGLEEYFCSELLKRLSLCTDKSFWSAQYILKAAFAAGCFCRVLSEKSECDDIELHAKLISLIEKNTLSTETWLVSILNHEENDAKKHYEDLRDKAIQKCLEFFSQNNIVFGENVTIKNIITIIRAVFSVGYTQHNQKRPSLTMVFSLFSRKLFHKNIEYFLLALGKACSLG